MKTTFLKPARKKTFRTTALFKTITGFVVILLALNGVLPKSSGQQEYGVIAQVLAQRAVLSQVFALSALPLKLINTLCGETRGPSKETRKAGSKNKHPKDSSSDYSLLNMSANSALHRLDLKTNRCVFETASCALFPSLLNSVPLRHPPPITCFVLLFLMMLFFLLPRSSVGEGGVKVFCRKITQRAAATLGFFIINNARKMISILTLCSFVISSLFGQGYALILEERGRSREFKKAINTFVIPPTVGRITEARYFGGKKVVITIQDLHCHSEVQRNINRIIELLDEKYNITQVYQEGAIGDVDTSWLGEIDDKKLKQALVESLIGKGLLTGAEYHSAVSGKYGLIRGLENEQLYRSNVLRLGRILDGQPKLKEIYAELKGSIVPLEDIYYGDRNKRLTAVIRKYQNGKIGANKYYSLLLKYGKKLGIDVYSYRNMTGYLSLIDAGGALNYRKVTGELQGLLAVLKQKMPYAVFRHIEEQTGQFSRWDTFILYVPEIEKKYALDIERDYPHLKKFIRYLDASLAVNPIDLIKEERKLAREIQARLSDSDSESEVVFLSYFIRSLEDYIENKVSREEYEYLKQNFARFSSLCSRYNGEEALNAMASSLGLLGEYYAVNAERDQWFLRNSVGDTGDGAATGRIRNSQNDPARIFSSDSSLEPVIAVMGGFHTPGFTELLKEKNISYVVITPNVTGDTKESEAVYTQLIRQQERASVIGAPADTAIKRNAHYSLDAKAPPVIFPARTLAVALISQDPPDISLLETLNAYIGTQLRNGVAAREISSELNEALTAWESKFGKKKFELISSWNNGADYSFSVTGIEGARHYLVENGTLNLISQETAPARLSEPAGVLSFLRSWRGRLIKTISKESGLKEETGNEQDRSFMREALKEAEKARRERGFFSARVGVAVIRDGTVIGRAYNKPNNVLHAEQFALIDALKFLIDSQEEAGIGEEKGMTLQRLRARLEEIEKESRRTRINGEYGRFFREVTSAIKTTAGELCRTLGIPGQDFFKGVDVYVTLEPCKKCASMLQQLGVGKVVFGAPAVQPAVSGKALLGEIPSIPMVLAREANRLNAGYRFLAGNMPWLYAAAQALLRSIRNYRETISSAQDIQHSKMFRLRGKRHFFTANDAFREVHSEVKNWMAITDVPDGLKDAFEMPEFDRVALEDAFVFSSEGEIGALLSKAVSSLPPELQAQIRNRRIRISLFHESQSKYLFEDHRKNGYIGINRTFLKLSGKISAINPDLLSSLFIMGIAHELRHEAGIREENIRADVSFFKTLVMEYGISPEDVEQCLSRLDQDMKIDEFARALRKELMKSPAAKAGTKSRVMRLFATSMRYLPDLVKDRMHQLLDSRPKESFRVEFSLPGSFEERIEQSARLLLPYSRLLSAVNILLMHPNTESLKRIAFDFHSDEDAAKIEGDTLHLYIRSPEELAALEALKIFQRDLGWDFKDALRKMERRFPHLLLTEENFEAINVVLHKRMAGLGDLVFVVNAAQVFHQAFPRKKIRVIFHTDEDAKLVAETKLLPGIEPDKPIQTVGGIEIVNASHYGELLSGQTIPASQYWKVASDKFIGENDVSIVYALGSTENDVLNKKSLFTEYAGRAKAKVFIHELGFESLLLDPLSGGDAHLGLGGYNIGMPPVSPFSKELYSKKYPRVDQKVREERKRILKKFPGWQVLDEVTGQKDLARTVASEWGFLYVHTDSSIRRYFGVFEAARQMDSRFAAGDKTFFVMCGRSDKSVHERVLETAEKNDYNLLIFDNTSNSLRVGRRSQENKVTIIMDYSVPRKLFGELFLYSDDLPTFVTGQDNLANILYLNQLSDGRPFFWEVLVFQGTAADDFSRFVRNSEKLGPDYGQRLSKLWHTYSPDSYKDAAGMFFSPRPYRIFFKNIATIIGESKSFLSQMYYLMLRRHDQSQGWSKHGQAYARELIEGLENNAGAGDVLHHGALRLKGKRRSAFTPEAALQAKNAVVEGGWKDVPGSRDEWLSTEFQMPTDQLKELAAALTDGNEGKIGALLKKAVSSLPTEEQDRLRGKTIRISLLQENASRYLFEDHSGNGFIGINRTFLAIARETSEIKLELACNLLVTGIAHELRHEAGVTTEDINFDAELFHRLMRENRVSMEEFERFVEQVYIKYVRQRRILNLPSRIKVRSALEFEKAVQELKTKSLSDSEIDEIRWSYLTVNGLQSEQRRENEARLFRELVVDNTIPLPRFLASDAWLWGRSSQLETRIAAIRDKLSAISGDARDIEQIIQHIREGIGIIYRHIPPDLFKRYYTDVTIIPYHALSHSLDVLMWSVEILQREGRNARDVDFRTLVYASLMHDLSCIIHRGNHVKNSALWIESILREEGLEESAIAKIADVARGHEKKRRGPLKKEHEIPEAQLLHDADMLSAVLDLERIYQIWQNSPNPEEKFFKPELSVEGRITILENGEYYRGDGLNDLMRQGWLCKNPELYLTGGARKIVVQAGTGKELLMNFVEGKKGDIQALFGLDDDKARAEIEKMKDILEHLYPFLTEKGLIHIRSPTEIATETILIEPGKNDTLLERARAVYSRLQGAIISRLRRAERHPFLPVFDGVGSLVRRVGMLLPLSRERQEVLEIARGETENPVFVDRNNRGMAHIVVDRTGRTGKGILIALPKKDGNPGFGAGFDGDVALKVDHPRTVKEDVNHTGVTADVEAEQGELDVRQIFLGDIRDIRDALRTPALMPETIPPHAASIFARPEIRAEKGHTIVEFAVSTQEGRYVHRLRFNFPRGTAVTVTGKDTVSGVVLPGLHIKAPSKRLRFTLTATTTHPPLKVKRASEIFRWDLIRHFGTLSWRHLLGLATARQQREWADLFTQLFLVRLLVSGDGMLAGSWRFLTYFGRDTMLSVLMLRNTFKPGILRAAMQSVIDRVRDDGRVAHEEDMRKRPGERGRLDYKMVDDDLMLPVAIEKILDDMSYAERDEFLDAVNGRGETNRATLERNFSFIMERALRYHRDPVATSLVSIGEGLTVGNWRDSMTGLGGGVYPADVNAVWMPAALESIGRIAAKSGVRFNAPDGKPVDLDAVARSWRAVGGRHFRITLSADDVHARLTRYYRWLEARDPAKASMLREETLDGVVLKDFLERYNPERPETYRFLPATLEHGFSSHALSLDKNGFPLGVVNSDVGLLRLFNDEDLTDGERRELLAPFMLPYAFGGLMVREAGTVIANPMLFDTEARYSLSFEEAPAGTEPAYAMFGEDRYHGAVVWGWQLAMLHMSVLRHLRRSPDDTFLRETLKTLDDIYDRVRDYASDELWGITLNGGKTAYEPCPFGKFGDETESNLVQLWSFAWIAVSVERLFEVRSPQSIARFPALPVPDLSPAIAAARIRWAAAARSQRSGEGDISDGVIGKSDYAAVETEDKSVSGKEPPDLIMRGAAKLTATITLQGFAAGIANFVRSFPRKNIYHIIRGPLLQINALALGAHRNENGDIVLGKAQDLLSRVRAIAQHYSEVYLVGLLPIGDEVRRLGRGEREGEEKGTPFYALYYGSERVPANKRMVIYQPWEGNKNSVGSSFASSDPRGVNPEWGTFDDLETIAAELHRHGARTYVDVVPNHVGVDNPWMNDNWDATVHVTLEEIIPEPLLKDIDDRTFFNPGELRMKLGNDVYERLADALRQRGMSLDPEQHHFAVFYSRPGDPSGRVLLAHGRDPNFIGWFDTIQLDYTNKKARDYVLGTLKFWAEKGIDVRTDMSNLIKKQSFKLTWYPSLSNEDFNALWPDEFWGEVVREVMEKYTDFVIIMEAYEDHRDHGNKVLEYLRSLHPRILVYRKDLLDKFLARDMQGIRNYLRNEVTAKDIHFLQNHDDSAPWYLGKEFIKAASAVVATIPGVPFIHYRQTQGLGRLPIQEPLDNTGQRPDGMLETFYDRLALIASQPISREGSLYVVDSSNPQLLAYTRSWGDQKAVVVVNISDTQQNGVVPLIFNPQGRDAVGIPREGEYIFNDVYYDLKSLEARSRPGVQQEYRYSGENLNNKGGLEVILDPGDAHIFIVEEAGKELSVRARSAEVGTLTGSARSPAAALERPGMTLTFPGEETFLRLTRDLFGAAGGLESLKRLIRDFKYLANRNKFNWIIGASINREVLSHLLTYLLPPEAAAVLNIANRNCCSVVAFSLVQLLKTFRLPAQLRLVTVSSIGHVTAGIQMRNYLLVLDYDFGGIFVLDLRKYRKDANPIIERYTSKEAPFEEYEEILVCPPESAESIYLEQIGLAYRKRGKPEEAIEYFRAALRIDPVNYLAYYNMGLTYEALGDREEAAANYRRSLEIHPHFDDAQDSLDVLVRAQEANREQSALGNNVEKLVQLAVDELRRTNPANMLLSELEEASGNVARQLILLFAGVPGEEMLLSDEDARTRYGTFLDVVKEQMTRKLETGRMNGYSVEIKVSRDPALIQEDAWALASMAVNDRTHEATLYVHREFLEGLRNKAPPTQRYLLGLLAAHEVDEYLTLQGPGSPAGAAFRNYLSRPDVLDKDVSSENFHRYIEYLSRKQKEELTDEERELSRQRTLLRYAGERVRYDTRPVNAALLSELFVIYNMAIKEKINPENRALRAIYGGAGADISSFLLSTNARTAYFADYTYTGLSLEDFEKIREYIPVLNNIASAYKRDKFNWGYSSASHVDTKEKLIIGLLCELKSLGVDLSTLRWDQDGNYPRITFRWAYHRSDEQDYSITFVAASIASTDDYPAQLVAALEEGFDIYYQKAGMRIPLFYDDFIPFLYSYLNPGGYFVTDDATPDDGRVAFPIKLGEIGINRDTPFYRYITEPRDRAYGWNMTVRRKSPAGVGTPVTFGNDIVRLVVASAFDAADPAFGAWLATRLGMAQLERTAVAGQLTANAAVLQETLARLFTGPDDKMLVDDRAAAREYNQKGDDIIDFLQKSVAENLNRDAGTKVRYAVRSVKVSRNPALIRKDSWALSMMAVDEKTGDVVLYVHESFLDKIKSRKKLLEKTRFLNLLSHHEVDEYLALNHPESRTGREFTDYLVRKLKIKGGLSPAQMETLVESHRTSENFHSYIEELAGRPSAELEGRQERIALQHDLFDFAPEIIRIEDIIWHFQQAHPDADASLIRKAFRVAVKRYGDKAFDPSGQSYVRHVLDVAMHLARWGAEDTTIVAALLHKMDRPSLIKEVKALKKSAQPAIIRQVERLTQISKKAYADGEVVPYLRGNFSLQNYISMIVQLTGGDYQTLLLIFADRLQTFPDTISDYEKNYRYQEILHIYVPLAMRFNAYAIAEDVRNAALRLRNPEKFTRQQEEVEEIISMSYPEAKKYLDTLKAAIETELKRNGIRSAEVKVRVKTPYSAGKKAESTIRKEYSKVSELKDILGIHVIVKDADVSRAFDVVARWVDANYKTGKADLKSPAKTGFFRLEYNFVDRRGRACELCIYGKNEYAKEQMGLVDPGTFKSPWPHWIYKLGPKIKEESGVFALSVEFSAWDEKKKAEQTQAFTADNIKYSRNPEENFKALYDSLKDRVFVTYLYEDEKGGMSVLSLPRGAIPADVVADPQVDRFNDDYKGLARIPFVKHGEDQIGVDKGKTRQELSEDQVLETGDVVALNRETKARVLGSKVTRDFIEAKAGTVRVKLLLKADDKTKENLTRKGRKIVTDVFGDQSEELITKLDFIRQSYGLKNREELYLAAGHGLISREEINRYVQLMRMRIITVTATDRVGLLKDITTAVAEREFNIEKVNMDRGGEYVSLQLMVMETESSHSVTNRELKEGLRQISGVEDAVVGYPSLPYVNRLYSSGQALGKDIYGLLCSIYGIARVQGAARSLTQLLIEAFEKKMMLENEMAAPDYSGHLETIRSSAARQLGIEQKSVRVVVSTNEELIQKGSWCMGTMDARVRRDSATGKDVVDEVTVYVHKVFLDALRNKAPPGMAALLSAHEVDEFQALYIPESPVGHLLTEFLRGSGLSEQAALLPEHRTSQSFHDLLVHLDALRLQKQPQEGLSPRLADQAALLEFAKDIAEDHWAREYAALAQMLLSDERDKRLFEKVNAYYRNTDAEDFRQRIAEMSRIINPAASPQIQEIYGVGYPFYGNVDIGKRIFATLVSVLQGIIPGRQIPIRILPDIDLLLVYGSPDKGPWVVQENMDARMMDRFVEMAGYTEWRAVFGQLARKYDIINKLGYDDYDPVALFMGEGRLNIDLLPVAWHVWANMPVFVLEEDIKRFKFIRDLLFTMVPLSRQGGGASSADIPLEFRRNFALYQLSVSETPLTDEELIAGIIAIHPYRNLIEMYGETREWVEGLFKGAIRDAWQNGLIKRTDNDMLLLTPKGKRFLEYVLHKRAEINRQGYRNQANGKSVDEAYYNQEFYYSSEKNKYLSTSAGEKEEAGDHANGSFYGKKREEYLDLIRHKVNPEGAKKTVFYIGAAGDISTALKCADAETFIFADALRFRKGNMDDLDDKEVNRIRAVYLEEKQKQGWSRSETLDIDVRCAELPLRWELEAMGVPGEEIEVTKEGEAYHIVFTLPGETRKRDIFYYEIGDAQDEESFPSSLRQRVAAGVDVAMSKAFYNIEIAPGLKESVVKNLVPGGIVISDDAKQWGFADVRMQLRAFGDEEIKEIREFEKNESLTFGYSAVSILQKVEKPAVPHLAAFVTGNGKIGPLAGAVAILDPRRVLTGEGSAKAAARVAARTMTKTDLAELHGKTVVHYYDDINAVDPGEIAALDKRGINNIVVVPYRREQNFREYGRIPIERDGVHAMEGIMAGAIRDAEGRSVGVLAIEGLRPEELPAIVQWLNNTPQLHIALQRRLELPVGAIEPAVIEINSSDIPEHQRIPALRQDIFDIALRNTALVYRERKHAVKAGKREEEGILRQWGPYFDEIIHENEFAALEEEARAKELADVYRSALLRKSAESVAKPGMDLGEYVFIPSLPGQDSRTDLGTGEFPGVVTYLMKLKKAGRNVLQMLPLTLPAAYSPFEPFDLRAGDYSFINIFGADEVKKLDLSPEDLYVAEAEKESFDRARVNERKFKILNSAREILYAQQDGERFRALSEYIKQESFWLDPYVRRMAAARIAMKPLLELDERSISDIEESNREIFKGYTETYGYMQWIFGRQLEATISAVHDNGGKILFWVDVDRENIDSVMSVIPFWFAYGFDGVRINIKDRELIGNDTWARIKDTIRRSTPDAEVLVSLPETAPGIDSSYLYGRFGFRLVRSYDALQPGENVSKNDLIEMGKVDAPYRAYARPGRKAADVRSFYQERMHRVAGAAGIFFILGDLLGDTMALASPDEEGKAQWNYRMPRDGTVDRDRVQLSLDDWARDFIALSSGERNASYSRGYGMGLEMAKTITPGEAEMRILNRPLRYTLRVSDKDAARTITGYGLHVLPAMYRFIKGDRDTGEKVLRYHAAKGIMPFVGDVHGIAGELAARDGANQKYWRAVLSQVRYLHRQMENALPEERAGHYFEWFGFAQGILEGIHENLDRGRGLPLAGKTDRMIKRALLSAASPLIAQGKERAGTKDGVFDAGALVGTIDLLLSLNRFSEAEALFREFRARYGGGELHGREQAYLEFIELLNRYYIQTRDEEAKSFVRDMLKGAGKDLLRAAPEISGNTASLGLRAFYYNALMILAKYGTEGDWGARAAVLREALQRELPAELEMPKAEDLYLVSLSAVISTEEPQEDLVPSAEGKRRILDAVKDRLLGPFGLRGEADGETFRPEMAGHYARALLAVRRAEARDKGREGELMLVRETAPEIREIINPLFGVLLEGGASAELSGATGGRDLHEPLTIAELSRILDLIAKPELPETSTSEKAFRGAIRMFDVRATEGLRRAS